MHRPIASTHSLLSDKAFLMPASATTRSNSCNKINVSALMTILLKQMQLISLMHYVLNDVFS